MQLHLKERPRIPAADGIREPTPADSKIATRNLRLTHFRRFKTMCELRAAPLQVRISR